MNNEDGPIITKKCDKGAIIRYLDEVQIPKLEKGLRKYFIKAYKYYVFDLQHDLKHIKRPDGEYEINLPVEEVFNKVYGQLKVKFMVKNGNVIIKTISPEEILLAAHMGFIGTYRGIPYRDEKDLTKIELMWRLEDGKRTRKSK